MFDEPVILSHATSLCALKSIAAEGLRPHTYFSSDDGLTSYYMETVQDEDKEPVVLLVHFKDLDPAYLAPDSAGIDEPITCCIDFDEDELIEEWEEREGTWQDSLELIHSLRYEASIPPHLISVELDDGDTMLLSDYVARMDNQPNIEM